MLPSRILCCWASFFFDTDTRFQTHSLFVYMSPASQCCFQPYFTLTGIIDTYANRTNSPRQHHILWHQRQKVDRAWMACVCVCRGAHKHTDILSNAAIFISLTLNSHIIPRMFPFKVLEMSFFFWKIPQSKTSLTSNQSPFKVNNRNGHNVEPSCGTNWIGYSYIKRCSLVHEKEETGNQNLRFCVKWMSLRFQCKPGQSVIWNSTSPDLEMRQKMNLTETDCTIETEPCLCVNEQRSEGVCL